MADYVATKRVYETVTIRKYSTERSTVTLTTAYTHTENVYFTSYSTTSKPLHQTSWDVRYMGWRFHLFIGGASFLVLMVVAHIALCCALHPARRRRRERLKAYEKSQAMARHGYEQGYYAVAGGQTEYVGASNGGGGTLAGWATSAENRHQLRGDNDATGADSSSAGDKIESSDSGGERGGGGH